MGRRTRQKSFIGYHNQRFDVFYEKRTYRLLPHSHQGQSKGINDLKQRLRINASKFDILRKLQIRRGGLLCWDNRLSVDLEHPKKRREMV